MEDPNAVREIGLELWMEAPVGDLSLRGIIDRLELDADGELVVTDYKTGRAPSGNYEQKSLAGVHFYSFLCEARVRQAPGEDPPDVPEDGRDHRNRAVGAVGEVHHHPHVGRVVGGRAGVYVRRLPAAAEQPVRLLLVQAVVSVVRRRPGTGGRRGGRRVRSAAGRSDTGYRRRVSDDLTPGQGHLGPEVDRFDERADELLDLLRGHPAADRLFLAASHLGDFSLIWHLIGITRGIIKRRPDQVVILAASLGIESLVVNQGVKRLFSRERPTTTGHDHLVVRKPRTSSFPPGMPARRCSPPPC